MKLQFKIRNGDVLDVKKAFVFRLNFDKEYLFYTTETFKDDDMVPVIFGEMIGPSVIKVAPEERNMFEQFLYALANDKVDNISNYELVNYKQLDVTILSAQKTKLPAYILNKYSFDFEVVMPPKYDVINDPTPEIIPAIPELKPSVIGNIKEEEEKLTTNKEESSIKKQEDIDSSALDNNKTDDIVSSEISNKVYEQLVNSDPVNEVTNTLESLPLELNKQAMSYKSLNNLPNANQQYPEPVIAKKEEKTEAPKKQIKKKNNLFQIFLIAILLAGVIYFGYNWISQTYLKKDIDNLVASKTTNIFCETHPIVENNYRSTSRIDAKFINDFLTEYVETKSLEFSNLDDYNAYKLEHQNDALVNNAGYYETVSYLDESMTVSKEIKIVKDDMSFNDWVSYLGEDTTYTYLWQKYYNNGYVCSKEA